MNPSLKDHGEYLCVDGMRTALGDGVKSVVGLFLRPGVLGQSDYSVTFRYLEFRHSPASGGGTNGLLVQLSMRWQCTVQDRSGAQVVSVTETTIGPERLLAADAADAAIASLLRAVVDRIGQALAAAKLGKTAAAAPRPLVPRAATACIPGVTQACIGPGGCNGGQACVSNGSGFGPCDCGGK